MSLPILSTHLDRLLRTISKKGAVKLQEHDSLLLSHYGLVQTHDGGWELTDFGLEYLKTLPPNYPLELGALDFEPSQPSVIDNLLSHKPSLTHHLEDVLRKIAETGVKDIEHSDIADLVLYGYVTFKFFRGWVISKQGKEYIKGNTGE